MDLVYTHQTQAVRQLRIALEAAGLPVRVDEYGTIFIQKDPLSLFITQRPGHCDRGRWLVNNDYHNGQGWLVYAESVDKALLCIDYVDFFPRYYFFDSALVLEIQHWFTLRLAAYEQREERLKQHNANNSPSS